MKTKSHSKTSVFFWWVADLLRAGLKQSQCGRTILAFTLLRRLEFVLERIRQTTLKEAKPRKNKENTTRKQLAKRTAQTQLFEASRESLATLSYTLNHNNTQKAISRGAQFA